MLGAVVYDKTDVVTQLREGAQPRKMGVLLPVDIAAAAMGAPSGCGLGAASSAAAAGALSPEERLAAMASGLTTGAKRGSFDGLERPSQQDLAANGDYASKGAASKGATAKGGATASGSGGGGLASSTIEGTVDGQRGTFLQLGSKEPVFEKVHIWEGGGSNSHMGGGKHSFYFF
jgi:hypothetical protein